MLRCDIAGMSDVEIAEHLEAFKAEKNRRFNARKENAWRAVRKVVKDYVAEFGEINVCDKHEGWNVDITGDADYDCIGEIKTWGS